MAYPTIHRDICRWAWAWAGAAALIILCLPAGAFARPDRPSGNLVRNGGFELAGLDNAPEGWVTRSWRGEVGTFARVEGRGRFGQRLLHMTSRDAMTLHGCYTQPIDIRPYAGGQLLFSMHYRTGETPHADAIITTYADDFTRDELDTPSLSRLEMNLAPSRGWTTICHKLDVPLGARHALVLLRVSGRGDLYADGVALRALPAEVACDVAGAGLVVDAGKRSSIINLRNNHDGQVRGRLRMDVVDGDRTNRRGDQEFSLGAGEQRQMRVEYALPADRVHRVRLTVVGEQEDDIYAYEDLAVPGLIDARVTVPAFRSMLLDGIPTEYIQVDGRLHAVPEIVGKVEIAARLAADGRPGDEQPARVDQSGRFSLRMAPGSLVSGLYSVSITALLDNRPITAAVPFTKAAPGVVPVAYDDVGRLWANGTPRFPTGLIYALHAEDLPNIASAGFQFVTVPSKMASTTFMDAADANGLGVFISSASLECTFWENMADRHAQRPGFWGWYILENPELHMPAVTPELLHEIYRELTVLTQHRPVLCSISTADGMRRYGVATDVPIAWVEPRPPGDLLAATTLVSEAAQIIEPRKPLWARIPICGAAHARDSQLDPNDAGRPPTPDEYRAMVYLSIIHGAKGILGYTYRMPPSARRLEFDVTRDAPALWKRVGEVNREIAAVGNAILDGTRQPHPNQPEDAVQYAVWEYERQAIVILANRTGIRHVKPFVVDNLADNTLRSIRGPEQVIGSGNGQFGRPMEPYEVGIYVGTLR